MLSFGKWLSSVSTPLELIIFSETSSGDEGFSCLCGVNTANRPQEYGSHVNIFQQAPLSLWHLHFSLLSHHITSDLDQQTKHKKRH